MLLINRLTGYQKKPMMIRTIVPRKAKIDPMAESPVPGPTYAHPSWGINNNVAIMKIVSKDILILNTLLVHILTVLACFGVYIVCVVCHDKKSCVKL
jgi:hypothetical protein